MDKTWLGWAEIDPKKEVIAGSMGSWTIRYHTGKRGIDDGGSIRITRRSISDLEEPQFHEPPASGYTTVKTDAKVRLEVKYDRRGHIRPWKGAVQIDVRDGSLAEGDQVEVVLGDKRGGSPGLRMQTFRESEHIFKIFVDCFGTGRYEEIANSPRVRVIGGPAEEIQVVTPSNVRPGEVFSFLVRAVDSFGNIASDYEGQIKFSSSDKIATLPANYQFKKSDNGFKKLDSITFHTEGIHKIQLEDESGKKATSNPSHVSGKRRELTLLWGDIHGQTKQTVGTGTLDEYLSFVRDVAFMDFSSWQGNDFQVTKELWKLVKKKIKEYNQPGKFVTFLGYEWSGLTPAGGDHNIYFLGDEEEINRSNHWLIDDKSGEATDKYPISELWEAFKGRKDVMAIPHVGGRHANLEYFNPEIIPVIEVHSHHGTFEWFLEEALEKMLKVGFVANSDDHTCRPGLTSASGEWFTTRGGYTGVYARNLTREAIWEALRARHCYATTGRRVILWTEIDGHMMGDELFGTEKPKIKVKIAGTAPLLEVEVKRGLETVYRHPFAKPVKNDKLFKIEWSGVRVKSRPKHVDWTGGLYLDKGSISNFWEYAFDHSSHDVRRLSNQRLEWKSTTGGDPDGVILKLDAPEDAEIHFHSKPTSFSFKLGEIKYEPMVKEAGGVNQRVKVSTITDRQLPKNLEFTFTDEKPDNGVNPYWVRILQKDGVMAWSSPIFYEFQKIDN
jgi:hypothetical protein